MLRKLILFICPHAANELTCFVLLHLPHVQGNHWPAPQITVDSQIPVTNVNYYDTLGYVLFISHKR